MEKRRGKKIQTKFVLVDLTFKGKREREREEERYRKEHEFILCFTHYFRDGRYTGEEFVFA